MAILTRKFSYRGLARLVVFTLFLAAALDSLAAAQQPGGMEPVRVEVHNSIFKLLVYDDAAIQPVYNLDMTIYVPEGTGSSGKLALSYEGRYTGSEETTIVKGSGSIILPEPVDKPGVLAIEVSGGYQYNSGSGSFVMQGYIVLPGDDSELRFDIERLEATIEGSKIVVVADVVAPSKTVEGDGQEVPTADEINRQLASQGVDYIRVEELGAIMQQGDRVKLHIRASIDVDKAIAVAKTMGLSDSDAKAVKRLMSAELGLQGEFRVSMTVEAEGKRLTWDLSYSSKSSGDLDKAQILVAKTMPALQRLSMALAMQLSQIGGGAAAPMPMVGMPGMGMMQASIPLVKAAPSEARANAEIVVLNDRIEVKVDYQGHRVRVPEPSGDPARDAEKALATLSTTYSQMLPMVQQLAFIAPGIEKAVPREAVLEPVGESIELTTQRVPLQQLTTVGVRIAGSGAQGQQAEASTETTAAQTTMQTGQQTMTSEATVTTAKPAPATTSERQTTTTEEKSTGASSTLIAAGIVVVIGAAAAVMILLRR